MVRSLGKLALLAILIVGGLTPRPLPAQILMTPGPMFNGAGLPSSAPSPIYFMRFGLFYDGDYADALRGFQIDARGGIKTSQSRWIDSICYETMCGECYFQMGRFREALDHYTAALTLFRTFSNWMTQVQFSVIRPALLNPRRVPPWGVSTRHALLGAYPPVEKILQGQLDQTSVVMGGGIMQQANLYPVGAQEIVRCTTLAMRRRAMLLGPVAKYDPLTGDLVSAVMQPIGPLNHWSECWVDLERGLALAASGQESQAVSNLERSLLAGGQFDHQMTSVALLELGRHALGRNDYDKASWYFQEASYSAVNYPDYGVLEEALDYGAVTHLLANRRGLFPPLEIALQWAKARGLRQLRTSLLLSAAENLAVLGETRQASLMLEDARLTIGRRSMGSGRLGSRLHFLEALLLYQQRKVNEGDVALRAALEYMKTGSLRLFHIALVDAMYLAGTATQRMAVDLFSDVLRDPQAADWAIDPQESLAVLVTPHPVPFEHWFQAAFARRDTLGAIEVAERARRHRFFSSLSLGGRLESLRWLLEAPNDVLPREAQVQRQDLLTRYPAYDQLSRQAQAVRAKLAAMPPVAKDAAALRDQTRELNELAGLSSQQEGVLREIAVRREPATMVFPPLRSPREVQKSLPEKHAALGFFVAGSRWYGYLMNRQRVAMWEGGAASVLAARLAVLLHDFGQFQQNRPLALKEVTGSRWKQTGRQMLDALLKGSPADFSHPFDELIVVPDGVLWYLPFDALQVMIHGQANSLIDRFRIRCVPSLSLATPLRSRRTPSGPTAVVVGRLDPHHQDESGLAAFQQLAPAISNAVALRPPLPATTPLYKTMFRGLIVLDEVTIPEQDPYGWSPLPVERGKKGNALADWLLLPWGGPDTVLLPDCNTAAAEGLKRGHREAPGNDIFLAVCGLMANGAQTVLLSQWRTGGQSSLDLLREFTQELPHTSAAAAWQRAVALASDSQLNLDAEPRIKHNPNDEPPKASHPFFWAGYLLVDCGANSEIDQPSLKRPDIQEPPLPPKKADAAAAQEPPIARGKSGARGTSKRTKKAKPLPR